MRHHKQEAPSDVDAQDGDSSTSGTHKRLLARPFEAPPGRAVCELLDPLLHELRSSLSPQLLWIDVLRSELPEQELPAVSSIRASIGAQARLLDDVTEIVSALQGQLVIEPAEVDLRGCVEAAAKEVRGIAERRKVELAVVCPPTPVIVQGDCARLQRIALDLLWNTLSAVPRKSRVEAQVFEASGEGRIAISMPSKAAHAERLRHFLSPLGSGEPGTPSPRSRTPMRLVLGRLVLDLHGAAITLSRSDGEERATLTISLPIAGA